MGDWYKEENVWIQLAAHFYLKLLSGSKVAPSRRETLGHISRVLSKSNDQIN